MNHTTVSNVLNFIRPGEEWLLQGTDILDDSFDLALDWLSDTPKPTWSDIEQGQIEMEAAQEQQRQDALAARESALAKLETLGLTVTEIQALLK